MRVGIPMLDDRGMEGEVCMHFGQCGYFLLVDIENGAITQTAVVPNETTHGGGGCVTVDMLLTHKITHVIAGGMGMGAQQKFSAAGVTVFGCNGAVKEAITQLTNRSLSGLDACRDHGPCA